MNAINWIAYPGVTRSTKQTTWQRKGVAAVVAAASAGAAVGWLLGWIGSTASDAARAGIVAALAAAGLLLAGGGLAAGTKLLPQIDRETEQRLVHHGPLRWAAENGALLGVGFTSRLGTWLWYAVPVAAFATGSAVEGALVYGTYGFVRLLVPAILAGVSVRRMTIDVAATVLPLRDAAIRVADACFLAACAGALLAVW